MVFAAIMISTILLSIIAFCLSSMPEYRIRAAKNEYGAPEEAFDTIETFCVSIFTIEYLARLLCLTAVPDDVEAAYIERFGFDRKSNELPPMAYSWTLQGLYQLAKKNIKKLLLFVFSPLNIVDFIAIVPYYINLSSPTDIGGSLAILRVLRLARVLRLFKMSKRMEGVQVMGRTMLAALDALGFLLFFILLAVVLCGSIIFFCEGGDWDDSQQKFMRQNILNNGLEETPFKSIPHSFWWTIVTMTTVGYGDYVPTSDAGRAVASFVMLIGILVLAMPITVIGSAFSEEYNKARAARRERDLVRLTNSTPSTPKDDDSIHKNKNNNNEEEEVEPVTSMDLGSETLKVFEVKNKDSDNSTSIITPTHTASLNHEQATLLTNISKTLVTQNEELTRLRADCTWLRNTLEEFIRIQQQNQKEKGEHS